MKAWTAPVSRLVHSARCPVPTPALPGFSDVHAPSAIVTQRRQGRDHEPSWVAVVDVAQAFDGVGGRAGPVEHVDAAVLEPVQDPGQLDRLAVEAVDGGRDIVRARRRRERVPGFRPQGRVPGVGAGHALEGLERAACGLERGAHVLAAPEADERDRDDDRDEDRLSGAEEVEQPAVRNRICPSSESSAATAP